MTFNISVGNFVWWMVMAQSCIATILLYLLLRRKNEEQKRKAILFIGYAIMVLYFVQKILMFHYDRYISVNGTGWEHRLTELLPFNLCYLSVILMIIGAHLKNKYLLGFCFYMSSLGAVLALVAPAGIFTDTNLLQPAVGLFYFLHVLLIAVFWNIGFLGIVKPGKKIGIASTLLLYVIVFLIHIVNWLGRSIGLDSMNYIFTFDTEGSMALEMFWKLIPVPFVYLVVPGYTIGTLWAIFLTLLYRYGVLLVKGKVRKFE